MIDFSPVAVFGVVAACEFISQAMQSFVALW
jgi:hypothetical protein